MVTLTSIRGTAATDSSSRAPRPLPRRHDSCVGSAPRWLAPVIAGPSVSGVVRLVGSQTVVIELTGVAASGPRMVTVVGPAGIPTANTVVVPELPDLVEVSGAFAGDIVRVGEGRLSLRDLVVRVTRYRPSKLTSSVVDSAALVTVAGIAASAPTGLAPAFSTPALASLRSGDPSRIGSAAAELVGRGPGSTPSGDDVLAGVITAAHVLGDDPALRVLREAVPDLLPRTTLLSADLLTAALGGHVADPVLRLIDALRPGTSDDERIACTTAVLGLGHTSGADLLVGMFSTLRECGRRKTSARMGKDYRWVT